MKPVIEDYLQTTDSARLSDLSTHGSTASSLTSSDSKLAERVGDSDDAFENNKFKGGKSRQSWRHTDLTILFVESVQFKWDMGGNCVYLVLLQSDGAFISKERLNQVTSGSGKKTFISSMVRIKIIIDDAIQNLDAGSYCYYYLVDGESKLNCEMPTTVLEDCEIVNCIDVISKISW